MINVTRIFIVFVVIATFVALASSKTLSMGNRR